MKLINTVLSLHIGNEFYIHLSATGTCFWLRLLLKNFFLSFFWWETTRLCYVTTLVVGSFEETEEEIGKASNVVKTMGEG